MLVSLFSFKGSPGVTSTALTLAAAWPRPVVLLEADPAGGDLAYRCSAALGGPVYAQRGIVRLATAVRDGRSRPEALASEAQTLACGVDLIQGVTSTGQSRGMRDLWSAIAQTAARADVDVIADLGRIDRSSSTMPMIHAAQVLVPVAAASLESVMHLAEGIRDTPATIPGPQGFQGELQPILVGPDSHAAQDCGDLDGLLRRMDLKAAQTLPMPYDQAALFRLQGGERASSKLGRTLLLRAARTAAGAIAAKGTPATTGTPGGSTPVSTPAAAAPGARGSTAVPPPPAQGQRPAQQQPPPPVAQAPGQPSAPRFVPGSGVQGSVNVVTSEEAPR